MKLLAFLLRSSKSTVTLAMVAGIISGAANAALIGYANSALSQAGSVTKGLLWGFIGLAVLLPVTRAFSGYLLIRLAQKVIFDLRLHLCKRILGAPLRHLEGVGAHRLLATLTEDVNAISNAFINVPVVCIQLTVVIGCLGYLVWLSGKVFLLIFGGLLAGLLSIKLLEGRARKYVRLAREEQDTLFSHFRALTGGTKELKLHKGRRDAFLSDDLQESAESYRRHQVVGNTIYATVNSWSQIIFFGLLGILLFVIPTMSGVNNLTLTGYILTFFYMMIPIDILMSTFPLFSRASVSLRKVEKLGLSLKSQSTESQYDRRASFLPPWKQLELTSVTHTYYRENESSKFTLGPVDVSLRPGELVFLVGGNGSGKTTLAKILLGLYVPESGEIRLDGDPITDKNREFYRQHFTCVFSDFYLFNSLLGLDNPKLDKQAQEYLSQLQLDKKVEVKNRMLSTLDLSQGQRKRLALLTAYLEDRPIYVFDEWAADQDPLFKEIFYYNLLPELKARGKTVVVISHDDHYYHVGDRIIKLDYGKIEYDEMVESSQAKVVGLSTPVSH